MLHQAVSSGWKDPVESHLVQREIFMNPDNLGPVTYALYTLGAAILSVPMYLFFAVFTVISLPVFPVTAFFNRRARIKAQEETFQG